MDDEEMAWMIVHEEFNWARPGSRFSFNVKPSSAPQSKVHDFVDAAVAAGKAERYEKNKHKTASKPSQEEKPAE